jgi:hypothetical protein
MIKERDFPFEEKEFQRGLKAMDEFLSSIEDDFKAYCKESKKQNKKIRGNKIFPKVHGKLIRIKKRRTHETK